MTKSLFAAAAACSVCKKMDSAVATSLPLHAGCIGFFSGLRVSLSLHVTAPHSLRFYTSLNKHSCKYSTPVSVCV